MGQTRREFLGTGLGDAALLAAGAGPEEELTGLTLWEASEGVRKKAISPVDLTRACLERIKRLDPQLNAYITVTDEQALEQAKQKEAEPWSGPLHGIPIGIKDNIDTKGVRTTLASTVFPDSIPSTDAEVVRRLKAAGAVILGKENLHQVAFGITSAISPFGPVHNPWKLDRISGGSSGGSGAAVAGRLCFGSIGTDAGGSIRVPSAYCGLVGLKPTYGLVSMRGAGESGCWSTTHVGPICRTVADAALLLAAIAGYDADDVASIRAGLPDYAAALQAKTASFRLGIPRVPFYEKLDTEIETATSEALGVLRHLTAGAQDVQLPPIPDALSVNVQFAEFYAFHAPYFAKEPERYHESIGGHLRRGSELTTTDYIHSRRDLDRLRRAIQDVFSTVDLLITPTMAIPPLTLDRALKLPMELEPLMLRNTLPFNIYGLPTISVPCGFTSSGLPIGLQISGPHLGEPDVLALAHAYQQATEWHKCRPPL